MVKNFGKPQKGIISFYKRKSLFFLVLFVFAFIGIKVVQDNRYSADASIEEMVSNSSDRVIEIVILNDGSVTVDGEKVEQKVDLLNDSDELRLPILDNSGQYYDRITVNLNLPKNIAENTEHEFLGIHGVGDTNSKVSSTNRINYIATNVSSQATLTVVAKMPTGTVNPPLGRKILKLIEQVRGSYWFIAAMLLPILTFIIMLALLSSELKQQKIDMPNHEISSPPMAIPPAIVGALFSQKVGSREIAATLIDLALRGDIVIVDRERGFEFGKSKFDQRLLGFEKVLLSKIFKKNIYSDRSDIEERINNHFYSKKISIVSSGVYTLATRLGYFKVNPQALHAKYRFIGIVAFFVALGGFVSSLVWFTDPAYVVFFWVSMMVTALIISIIASRMPVRTIIGQEVLSNWLAFKKYLSSSEQIPFSENNQEVFQKYLPYALVLECEAAWARRFSEHNFTVPDWFLTEKNGLGIEDFCLSLFPIVSYVGRSLAALKEPGFE